MNTKSPATVGVEKTHPPVSNFHNTCESEVCARVVEDKASKAKAKTDALEIFIALLHTLDDRHDHKEFITGWVVSAPLRFAETAIKKLLLRMERSDVFLSPAFN